MILTIAVKQPKHLLDCFYPQAYNFQTVIDGNLTEGWRLSLAKFIIAFALLRLKTY